MTTEETVVADEETQATGMDEGGEGDAGPADSGDGSTPAVVGEDGEKNDEIEGEIAVQIGDEPPAEEEKAPDWVRKVRQENREKAARIRELEAQLQGQQKAATAGKKPEMSDPDIDYDSEKFEKRFAEWTENKRKADEQAAKIEQEQQKEQTAWKAKVDGYAASKTALKLPDMEDAEAIVAESLSEKQFAILIKGAKNPGLLVYALAKNETKLKEVAQIPDLVDFAAVVFRDVEGQLKVTRKAPPPPPAPRVEGSGAKSGTVDSTLDRLRAEAERTGDMTKVLAYKRQKKAA